MLFLLLVLILGCSEVLRSWTGTIQRYYTVLSLDELYIVTVLFRTSLEV